MNFITHAAAYSLFPRTTFEGRLLVLCDAQSYADEWVCQDFTDKYLARGFTPVRNVTQLATTMASRSSLDLRLGHRHVGDSHTWVMPFPDARQVNERAFGREHVSREDPVVFNSFCVEYNAETDRIYLLFQPVQAAPLVDHCLIISQSLACRVELCLSLAKSHSRIHSLLHDQGVHALKELLRTADARSKLDSIHELLRKWSKHLDRSEASCLEIL